MKAWTGTVVAAVAMGISGLSLFAQAGRHATVVSVQRDASDAGLAVLRQGGNAVDAAVAVGFALAVTFPRAGNIGGGGFMLVRMAPARLYRHGAAYHTFPAATDFFDFRERAPGVATADMYLDAKGNVVPGLSTRGYKAIGVPGTVAGLVQARAKFGRLTLAQDMAASIRLATEGYVLNEQEANSMRGKNLSGFADSRRIFQRDGNFYNAGETFKQPELAATLRRIAANPDEFYHGKMAAELAADITSHGGLITAKDLADYKVVERAPLVGQYTAHGQVYDIITSPPSSSGGIVLLETLNILSGFDLPAVGGDRSPGQVHLITEAFRRSYMDRNDYLGDPDYNTMPLAQMASPAYAAAWRSGIDPIMPTPSAKLKRPAGFLPPPPVAAPHKQATETTQYSIVDDQGNAVAVTYTLNGLFGCGATVGSLGIVLNNEMDDFTSKPGVPNVYKMMQGPANAVGPGHRPLSSMTPTIVTTHATATQPGELRLVLGSPGGSTIITTVTNDLLSILVNGLSVQASADAPRFHHQYLPDTVQFEKAFPHDVVEAMRARGYTVSQTNEADAQTPGVWGGSEQIEVLNGRPVGANDFRYPGGKVSEY